MEARARRNDSKDDRSDSRRLQFEFSADAYERLMRIKEATSASSYAELVRNALRIYEWIVEQEKNGYDIGLIKDDKLVKEVKFLF